MSSIGEREILTGKSVLPLLPPSLTLEKLRVAHGLVSGNQLLAEPMYLTGYIERMGTGTGDMIRRCAEAGLAELEFSVSDGFRILVPRSPAVSPRVASEVASEVAGEVAGEVTDEVTDEVMRLLQACDRELPRSEFQDRLGLKGGANFRRLYLEPALEAGLLEMTRPDTPQSRLQRYRRTEKGAALLRLQGPEGGAG